MADFAYNTGSKELWDGTIALLTDTIKVMLVAVGYVANRDDDVVDAGGANDAADHEISGTGYTAGWGGSGRKTLASKTITVDKTNDRSAFDSADVTWTAIDVVTEPSQLLMVKEGGANDTTSRLITHHDFAVTTNGGDVTAQIADLLRLSTV
jgi:hypothetical protein